FRRRAPRFRVTAEPVRQSPPSEEYCAAGSAGRKGCTVGPFLRADTGAPHAPAVRAAEAERAERHRRPSRKAAEAKNRSGTGGAPPPPLSGGMRRGRLPAVAGGPASYSRHLRRREKGLGKGAAAGLHGAGRGPISIYSAATCKAP